MKGNFMNEDLFKLDIFEPTDEDDLWDTSMEERDNVPEYDSETPKPEEK
jgi:hypothetical protein